MLFTVKDALIVADILRDAAKAEIMPRWRSLSSEAIRQKTSPLDLVTDADEAAERVIGAALAKAFPGAVVIGEESTEKDASLLDGIAGADLAFIIDPVDGTANFAAGLPLFGVMAAVTVRGETVAGVIYDPVGEDWSFAVRGEGAWTQGLDGARRDMRVRPAAPVSEMFGAVSWNMMAEPLRSRFTSRMPRVASTFNYRCAAHEYRLIADGHCHFAVFNRLMPWDHAAGVLLHSEAGGHAARYDGTPYTATVRTGGLLCAPDQESWRALLDALISETE